MTPVTTMAGRRLALFGLGGSGLATARALVAGGAAVVCWDDSEASLDAAREASLQVGNLREADWSGFAALVLAPGVPLTHPEPHWTVKLADAAGVEVIGDVELFCRERAKVAPGSPWVAITGTNGKSTTTALVAHILREAGRDVQMGGNIGTPILALAPPAPDRVHVIEMSSFQIDLTPSFNPSRPNPSPTGEGLGRADGPTVGVLLNITPDHLDRHGSMERYAAIKERLVQSAGCVALGIDDDYTRAIERGLWQPTVLFSAERNPGRNAIYAAGSRFLRRAGASKPTVLADLTGIRTLRGKHNAQNAAAALAALSWSFLPDDVVQYALRTFPGLPHRMETVGRRGRALFVNDSKATNADSAEKALRSFGHVHWILGGKPKAGGIEPLRPLFTKVDKAYLIGAATDEFAATLDGAVPFARCGTLEAAVAAAAADAAASPAEEPVILLSPACASYDQFRSFEHRGDRFRELVRALPGIEA